MNSIAKKKFSKLTIRSITILGIVAAIYVVVTLLLGSLSYMNIQFRISEALVLLCFYKKEYCYSLTIGCLIANLFSSMPIDIIFGTLATLLSVIGVYYIGKHKDKFGGFALIIASLFPIVFNAIIVGFELNIFLNLPLFLSMAQVALGEFVCITILGTILFKLLEKNRSFMNLIKF